MDSSMPDNNQIYILHVVPVAGVQSQSTLTIESVPIISDEVTYHETQNDNQPVYLPISTTSSNQLQMFESHQVLSYTSDPAICIATTSHCPATSFALPPSPPESTSPPSDTDASCSTQCTPSTLTQISHQPISQPESDHVEDKMNKQSHKSTFDGCKNEKNLVVPNGERQHTFHFQGCGKLLPTKTYFKDHLKSSHTGKRPYTCDFLNNSNAICGKTFYNEHSLKRHVRKHEEIHICSICSKVFATSRYLKQHITTHTGEKKHICSICTKRFRRKDHLNNHIRTHTGEKKHTCSICTKRFKREDHLNNHIRIHRNRDTEASCSSQCIPSTSTQIFHHPISQPESDHVEDKENKQSGKSTFDGYKNEKNLVVPNGKRQHTFHFEGCDKLLSTKTHLEDHLQLSHTGKRSYTCDFVNDYNTTCGKTFPQKKMLKRHVRIHGEKIHICSICSKGFTTSVILKRHIRTHTGEKKHICSICTKGFRRKDHLNNHIRTHTGEKKHTCSICSNGFTKSVYLRRHIRTHAGEKKHICSICTKGFRRKDHLNNHIRTHAGEKKHICSICPKKFRRKDHLNNHIRIHRNLKGKNLSVKTTNN